MSGIDRSRDFFFAVEPHEETEREREIVVLIGGAEKLRKKKKYAGKIDSAVIMEEKQ